ncbi:four helix bundle protein [Candidatus Pelagisphaera phototrophica]
MDREASETDTWLDFALDADYINQQTHENLSNKHRHIRSMLG